MYDALPTTEYIEANWKKVSPKERYQNDARKTINYGYGNEPKFPIRGTLEALRISNDRGQMVVNWQDTTSPGDCWKQTNCYWLEYMGFKIKEPVFKVIPIVEADDNLLNTDDLIIKYLMIDNNWSEEQAENHIKPVYEAMRKAEAVFYQP